VGVVVVVLGVLDLLEVTDVQTAANENTHFL